MTMLPKRGHYIHEELCGIHEAYMSVHFGTAEVLTWTPSLQLNICFLANFDQVEHGQHDRYTYSSYFWYATLASVDVNPTEHIG